jgi:predicted GNAT family acetyltransferase
MNVIQPSGNPSLNERLLRQIREYLGRHEAVNTIQLSSFLASNRLDSARTVLIATNDQGIAGIATQDGTFLMLLSHIEDERAIPSLVVEIVDRNIHIPGIMGLAGPARTFARYWARETGGTFSPGMSQRILQATSVTPPSDVAGGVRPMDDTDRDMLLEWFTDFSLEAEHVRPDQARRAGEAMLARLGEGTGGLIWLNEEEVPVSIACYKGRTPNGIRIGPVYTPPEHRRHGYAAAVTAATTQHLLDEGNSFVCLYTDAGNKTSNHVYEAIGYEGVSDSMQYRFNLATSDDELDA